MWLRTDGPCSCSEGGAAPLPPRLLVEELREAPSSAPPLHPPSPPPSDLCRFTRSVMWGCRAAGEGAGGLAAVVASPCASLPPGEDDVSNRTVRLRSDDEAATAVVSETVLLAVEVEVVDAGGRAGNAGRVVVPPATGAVVDASTPPPPCRGSTANAAPRWWGIICMPSVRGPARPSRCWDIVALEVEGAFEVEWASCSRPAEANTLSSSRASGPSATITLLPPEEDEEEEEAPADDTPDEEVGGVGPDAVPLDSATSADDVATEEVAAG